MHYQAAERSLLMLNSDHVQKYVKSNMTKAYPIVVKGLLTSSQQSHWNQTVTTITYSVIRSYMELNREQFEKLTAQAQQEQRTLSAQQLERDSKWERLHSKYRVPVTPSQFPLIQYKPPVGFEE